MPHHLFSYSLNEHLEFYVNTCSKRSFFEATEMIFLEVNQQKYTYMLKLIFSHDRSYIL